jgi:hypothetical protein
MTLGECKGDDSDEYSDSFNAGPSHLNNVLFTDEYQRECICEGSDVWRDYNNEISGQ